MQRIPKDFANRYCKNNLLNLAYLEVPSSKVWEVEVVHFEDQMWLDKGWLDFIDHHSISCGHFLMFGYDGRSHFNVTIFDLSETEIKYPTTENDSIEIVEVNPESHIGHYGVEEDDFSFGNQNNVIEEKESQEEHEQQSEIVPSKNEAEERGEIAINYQTPKLLEVYPESHRGKTKVSDVVERSVENIGRSFVQASKRKRQDGGVEEDDDVSVDIQNNVIEKKESQGEHEQQLEVERDEEMVLNYQKAKAFKSNNPFIISIMHPSYVSHSFSLSIPKKFAKRYFLNHHNVVLSVTGKGSWSVKCTIGTKNAKFSWKALVLDNKLKTGDVCVFAVIEGTMPVSINVIIFPAVFNTSKHAEVVSDSEDPYSQYISAAYQRPKAFTYAIIICFWQFVVEWSGVLTSQELPCSEDACCGDELRWMYGHTRSDKIKNEGSKTKMVWTCKEEVIDASVRRCERLIVGGTQRGRDWPKTYWGELIRKDMARLHITEDMTLDSKEWRFQHTLGDWVGNFSAKRSDLVLQVPSKRSWALNATAQKNMHY
ncbi:hypothetical protein H5410_014243 [Solanum commersonii]|uniref:TF-B3 domain-containing protein n=1 Tax=Solanum commersonii TaxID=4109 RepID=A0A9J5ZQP0_SOLCO|nr:hypothetical protein H5410_014243 [Solanum commersonii]